MTVGELIEELQQLPGNSDLRVVLARVIVNRPYATDVAREGTISRVSLERDAALLTTFIYIE